MGNNSNAQQILDELLNNLRKFKNEISKESVYIAADYMQIAFDKIQDMKKIAEIDKRRFERKRREEEIKRREEERIRKKQEHVEEVTCMDLPLDWNNPFNSDSRAEGIHIESIADALVKSISTLGMVDIEFIASVTGNDYNTVITALKGSIYQNPLTWGECFYKGWETAEEYLSGNLRQKYNAVIAANVEYNGYFSENQKAIERVMPKEIASKDIYITLGSPWVPTDVIEDFIGYLFGEDRSCYWYNGEKHKRFIVLHDEITGKWEIGNKTFCDRDDVYFTNTYGTNKINALQLLEKTLNMRPIVINDFDRVTNKKTINRTETALALEKQKILVKKFKKWVWSDSRRKERLKNIFEENYSCARRRVFDGSFLEFPNMSSEVQLYPYQKDAVARIIFTPNTLLAHDVGAGKTYIMIAAGMELRRMGLSKKNLYVVPNNVQNQWVDIFKTMYPQAKLLVVNQKNFSPSKRADTLQKMRDDDYDAIIITYSSFGLIPISKDYYAEELSERIKLIEKIVYDDKSKATSALNKHKDKLKKQLSELIVTIEELYDGVYFDDLQINRLFVDEAHNFKNVPITTSMDNVMGINKNGSKRCQNMMDKVHIVQRQNDGKGVVFATGTPITNSVTDAYIMQTYLQSGELAGVDLQNFDSWVGMFAEKKQEFEIDVDTSNFRIATRLSKFHNLPELTSLLSSVADFHTVDNDGLPFFEGYITSTISKSDDFKRYLNDISNRAELVRNGSVPRTKDNMLMITTDGRKAALDLRLVKGHYKFIYNSKVRRCAENVFDIYFKTRDKRSTQIIFCDISTPKSGFNIYDELKNILISFGILENEIAFIHDAQTEKKRKQLFSQFNAGMIRVLIGSTFKLGVGVNVQQKLYAIHHLDVPWRPADMTQREGRILRQGNTNQKVKIFRYITEGSFDAYSWQLLETKQRFITDLLSGSVIQRSSDDIDDTVLDYAEVKALTIGNPLIKERVETANELNRLIVLRNKHIKDRMRLEQELAEIPSKILSLKKNIENCRLDIEQTKQDFKEYSKEERTAIRDKLHKVLVKNTFQIRETVFMNYQGFEIIIPANMTADKPYIWLRKSGRYFVELGDTAVGNLRRIDNYIESLPMHYDKLQSNLVKLTEKQTDIKAVLEDDVDYSDKIDNIKKKLKTIDDNLGVGEYE